MSEAEKSKGLRLKWWHKLAIVLFVILSSLFVLFLSLRVNWVEPVDLTGFRFEPLNQNPPLEEMPEDAYMVRMVSLLKEFENVSDIFLNDPEVEEDYDRRYESDEYANLVSLRSFPAIRRSLKVFDKVMHEICLLESYPDIVVPAPNLEMVFNSPSIMETYLDYMLLTAESGDVGRFKEQFKHFFTIITAQQNQGFLINELVLLAQLGILIPYMESFNENLGDKLNLPELFYEGYDYYLNNRLPLSEIYRGEYMFMMDGLLKAYESPEYLSEMGVRGDYDWLRNEDGYPISKRNLQYYWRGLISHFETNPDQGPSWEYTLEGLDAIPPYEEYFGDYSLLFVRDAYGYAIQRSITDATDGMFLVRQRTHTTMNFIYTYLIFKRWLRINGKPPKSLSDLNDLRVNQLVMAKEVYYSYFSDDDWYLTAFDPSILPDLHKCHEDLKYHEGEIDMWMIRHATKSVRELFEGPVSQDQPAEPGNPEQK